MEILFSREKVPLKCALKINWSVKTPSHRPSMGVACRELWAPGEDSSLQILQPVLVHTGDGTAILRGHHYSYV